MDKIIGFFKESYSELQKVTWMSRNEVIGSTVVIVILIAILSVFVTLVDFVFLRFVGWMI